MKLDTNKFSIAATLLVAICSTFAYGQETTGHVKANDGEITFSAPEQSSWRKVFYSNKNISHQLFPRENSYFDEGDASDLSEDKHYLKINKVSRGFVQAADMRKNTSVCTAHL